MDGEIAHATALVHLALANDLDPALGEFCLRWWSQVISDLKSFCLPPNVIELGDKLMSLLPGRSLLAAGVPGGESLQDVGAPLDGDLPLGIDVAVHLSAGQPFLKKI